MGKQKYSRDQWEPLISIFLSFVSSNRFQIENRVKTRKRPGVFRKFSLIEILFFENFRREFLNSSFDRDYHTEKRYDGTFFDKMNI